MEEMTVEWYKLGVLYSVDLQTPGLGRLIILLGCIHCHKSWSKCAINPGATENLGLVVGSSDKCDRRTCGILVASKPLLRNPGTGNLFKFPMTLQLAPDSIRSSTV